MPYEYKSRRTGEVLLVVNLRIPKRLWEKQKKIDPGVGAPGVYFSQLITNHLEQLEPSK